MIFALSDLIAYTFSLGQYSAKSVFEQNGFLAEKKLLDKLKNVKVGNQLFVYTRFSILSWGVMYYQGGLWSHVATFAENGILIDATIGGVIEHSVEDYLDGKSYILIIDINATEYQRNKILDEMRKFIGCGFNYYGVFRLWLRTIFGVNDNWKLKFTLDIILLFILAAMILPRFETIFSLIGIAYILLVGVALIVKNIIKDAKNKLKSEEEDKLDA
jgi:hypothetical protein